MHTHPYLRRTKSVDREIHKVTTGVSLLTRTSSTTKSITSINLGINPERKKSTSPPEL